MKKSKRDFRDFPGGPVVKNSLSSAEDQGLIPDAMEQLSSSTTTTEPMCSRACSPQLESMCSKRAHTMQQRSWVLQLRPKAAK